MLAIIVKPFDPALIVTEEGPPLPFGADGFGPEETYAQPGGAESRVVFADDTFIGAPGDTQAAADSALTIEGPPAAFGADGFGPEETYSVTLPPSALPASENLANVYFAPRLKSSFNFEARLFDGEEPAGRSRTGQGEMTVLNTDGGLDAARLFAWDGRRIEIFEGDKTKSFYPNFARRFVGRIDNIEWNDRALFLRLRDPQLRADNRVQQASYGGTGGSDGDADLKGVLKSCAFGFVENAAARLINAASLVYQVHTRAIKSIAAVRDQGAALTFDADYADYAALAAAAIPAGRFATALAQGLIRLAAAPAGQVTADLEGDAGASGADYVSDTGGIVRRIATDFLPVNDRFLDPDEIDSAAFAALFGQQPAEAGYFCDAGERASEVFDRLLAAIGGAWSVTLLGQLAVRRLEAPTGTALASVAARQIKSTRTRRHTPRWRTRIGYRRMWHVQSKDSLAAGVSETNKTLYSEQYRWAESSDSPLRNKHLAARDAEVAGFFRFEADAAAEAARQQKLFGTARRVDTISVKGLSPFARDLGDIVAVEGESDAVLIGTAANVAAGTLEYELWR